MSLNNKIVLITGGSSGIGAAIALKFAEEGAKVAIVGRNEKKLSDVSVKCEKTGSKPLVITADVTKDNDVERIIKETIKHYGKTDVLINNAGIAGGTSIDDGLVMQTFDHVMSTNLRSVVYLTHLASKYLIETKGNIINISSISGLRTIGNKMFAYETSKAALDHFSRAVASELASKGVRVNVISPGPVKTDAIENMGATAEQAEMSYAILKNFTALRRISEPEEVADLALFLASDKAIAITGACFVTDNGSLVNPVHNLNV